MARVSIPNVGIVEFPDTMTKDEITKVIETEIIPKYAHSSEESSPVKALDTEVETPATEPWRGSLFGAGGFRGDMEDLKNPDVGASLDPIQPKSLLGKAASNAISNWMRSKGSTDVMRSWQAKQAIGELDDPVEILEKTRDGFAELTPVETAMALRGASAKQLGNESEYKKNIEALKTRFDSLFAEGMKKVGKAKDDRIQYKMPDSKFGAMLLKSIESSGFTIESALKSGTAWALGGPLAGLAMSGYNTMTEADNEAGDVFMEMVKKGASPEEIENAVNKTKAMNMAVLGVSNTGGDVIAFGLDKVLSNMAKRIAGDTFLKKTGRFALTKGVPYLGDAIPEAGEEAAQSVISQTAQGKKINSDEIKESAKMGLFGGLLYPAAGRAARSATRFLVDLDTRLENLGNKAKEETPSDQKQAYEDIISKVESGNLTAEEIIPYLTATQKLGLASDAIQDLKDLRLRRRQGEELNEEEQSRLANLTEAIGLLSSEGEDAAISKLSEVFDVPEWVHSHMETETSPYMGAETGEVYVDSDQTAVVPRRNETAPATKKETPSSLVPVGEARRPLADMTLENVTEYTPEEIEANRDHLRRLLGKVTKRDLRERFGIPANRQDKKETLIDRVINGIKRDSEKKYSQRSHAIPMGGEDQRSDTIIEQPSQRVPALSAGPKTPKERRASAETPTRGVIATEGEGDPYYGEMEVDARPGTERRAIKDRENKNHEESSPAKSRLPRLPMLTAGPTTPRERRAAAETPTRGAIVAEGETNPNYGELEVDARPGTERRNYRGRLKQNYDDKSQGVEIPVPGGDGGDAPPYPDPGQASETNRQTSRVKLGPGNDIDVEYHVVEAGSLIPSHTRTFDENPAYPAELQPRDRSRDGYVAQVEQMAGNLDPDLLMDSKTPAVGAPIVKDGIVESGNGRALAIQKAYDEGLAGKYKAAVIEKAASLGLDAEEISRMEQPVLVRERITEVDRRQFAEEANESQSAKMGATEQALVDARRLSSGLIDMMQAVEDGKNFIRNNIPFVREFIHNVIPKSEQNAILQKDGTLSVEGERRIANAVFAKAYGDASLIARISERTDNDSRNITNALMASASQFLKVTSGAQNGVFDADLDIAKDVAKAVSVYADVKDQGLQGEGLDNYFGQGDIFSERKHSREVQAIVEAFDAFRRSGKKLSMFLQGYNKAVESAGSPNEGNLFGDTRRPTKLELLESAVRKVENAYGTGEQSALDFSGRTEESVGESQGEVAVQGQPTGDRGEVFAGDNREDGSEVSLTDSLEKPQETQDKTAEFMDGASNRDKALVNKRLSKKINFEGKSMTKKDFVELLEGREGTEAITETPGIESLSSYIERLKGIPFNRQVDFHRFCKRHGKESPSHQTMTQEKADELAQWFSTLTQTEQDQFHEFIQSADKSRAKYRLTTPNGDRFVITKTDKQYFDFLRGRRQSKEAETSEMLSQSPKITETESVLSAGKERTATNIDDMPAVVNLNMQETPFGNLPDGWIVLNSQRPLPGHKTAEGKSLYGKYYSAIDTKQSDAGNMLSEAKTLDAKIVVTPKDAEDADSYVLPLLSEKQQDRYLLASDKAKAIIKKGKMDSLKNDFTYGQIQEMSAGVTGKTEPYDDSGYDLLPRPERGDFDTDEDYEAALNEWEDESGEGLDRNTDMRGRDIQEEQEETVRNLDTEEHEEGKKARIEDFGDKIGGARKDTAQKLLEAMELDIAKVPFSKAWPEPKYQKLINEGADPETVALIRALREIIPRKPTSRWRLAKYVQAVEAYRSLANDVLNGTRSADDFRNIDDMVAEAILFHMELYSRWGHERSFKDISLVKNDKGYSAVQDHVIIAKNSTREGLIEALGKEEMSASPKIAFDIYHYRGQEGSFVGKKIGSDYVSLFRFDSTKEARSFLKNHYDEVVAKLEAFRVIGDERRQENSPRQGPLRRKGDVTPEAFQDTFGFRGVEFGNQVTQKERQTDLNNTYDSFLDLAEVLGIPPKAISLNGELALAFGARGKGGKNAPKAHYERGKVVINLTRKNGPGSLAHEWFHAFDNYLSRKTGKDMEMGTEVLHARLSDNEGVRPVIVEDFKALRQAIKNTALKERSDRLDRRRTKSEWGTPKEMTARAFESYILHRLATAEINNDFLVNISDASEFAEDMLLSLLGDENSTALDVYPYLLDEELAPIAESFNRLFGDLETRETETGTELYQVAPAGPKETQADSSQSKLPPITKQSVESSFPGATVTEQDDGSFAVETPNGQVITVQPDATITMDKDAASKAYGREMGDSDEAVGSFQSIDGEGVIRLTDKADQGTLDHETWHAAKSFVISEEDAATLKKDYANEEQEAEAYRQWVAGRRAKTTKRSGRIFQKILDFFSRIKTNLFGKNSEDIFREVATGEAWEGKSRGQSPSEEQYSVKDAGDSETWQPIVDKMEGERVVRPTKEKKTLNERLKEGVEAVYDGYVDELLPLARAFGDKVYDLARVSLRGTSGPAMQMIERGSVDGKTKGLYKIFESLPKGEADGFMHYATYKHLLDVAENSENARQAQIELGKLASQAKKEASAMERRAAKEPKGSSDFKALQDQAKEARERAKALEEQADDLDSRIKKTVLNSTSYKWGIAELEKAYPHWKEAQWDLAQYSKEILGVLNEAGIISDKLKNELNQRYPNYVPLQRDFGDEETVNAFIRTKGLVNLGTPIKKLKGSDRDVIDPVRQIIENTFRAYVLKGQNDVAREIVKQVDEGVIPEEVIKPTEDRHHGPTEHVFYVWEDGEKRLFKTDADIYHALMMTGSRHPGVKQTVFEAIAKYPTKAIRIGATRTVGFALRNMYRDNLHAGVVSENGFVPFYDGVRGLFHVLTKSDLYDEFLRSGGAMGTINAVDRNYFQEEYDKVRELDLDHPTVKNMRKKAWRFLSDIVEASENATRMGEYMRAKESGKSTKEAALSARDLQDFERGGANSKSINSFSAFFNAGLQGMDKLIRAHGFPDMMKAFHETEGGIRATKAALEAFRWKTAFRATMYLSLPSILTAMFNLADDDRKKAYLELPAWRRDLFWNIVLDPGNPDTGDKGFILSFPKPFELGVLYGSIPERFAVWLHGKDKKAFDGLSESLASTFPSVLPNFLVIPLELATNRSLFLGRDIVPQSEQKLSPGRQSSPYTSEFAKWAGRTFNVSPRKVDYTLRSTFSSLGGAALKTSDSMIQGLRGDPRPEIPAKEKYSFGFMNRGYKSPQSVQDFYDGLDDLETMVNDAKDKAKSKEQLTTQDKKSLAMKGQLTALRRSRTTMGKLFRQKSAIAEKEGLSAKEKRERIDSLDARILRIATAENKRIDKVSLYIEGEKQ